VFTTPARPADPRPGTRPAPGLDRHDRTRRERDGYCPEWPIIAEPGGPDPREPIAVLADVLGRDGAELSASQTRQQNLANADHLGVLNAIWTAETRGAQDNRYRDLVTAALPPGCRQPLSHQARWLFRTLCAAELAGLDPAEVIGSAIASRDLAGARDIVRVLDARIRQRVYPLLPLTQIAAMMDDRAQRLGQHTAQTAPAWAITALGLVPAGPAARRDWEHKAEPVAAYREMYGYDHPDDPIGPEPSREAPDQRAAWHQAFAVLGPADGPNVRAMPDGRLWLIRDTYATETAWAPPHTGKELRLARLGATNADMGAIRAAAEADAARKDGDHARGGRHEELAGSYPALGDLYRQREQTLAQVLADRQHWEQVTAGSRCLAVAADAELRRRYPDQKIEPLRSAEPAAASDTERGQLHPALNEMTSETAAWMRELAVQRQAFRAKLKERQVLMVPSDDPGWGDLGQAFPARRRPAGVRSCGRPNRRSPPRPQCSSAARNTTLSPKPLTDRCTGRL